MKSLTKLAAISLCVSFPILAQSISITGTVVDSANSQAISGASVKLAEFPQFTTTTSSNGTFTLAGTATNVSTAFFPASSPCLVGLKGDVLSIRQSPSYSEIAVDVFTGNGSRIYHSEKTADANGSISFRNLRQAAGISYLRIRINGEDHIITSTGSASFSLVNNASAGLKKSAATYTLRVAASGYTTKNISMTSTQGDAGTIRLFQTSVQAAVWTNVTPNGINLSSDFGVMDVLADPAHPGVFYAFVCVQGVYKSSDWGVSWAHISTGNLIEQGRPWGEAIAPDGSYMLVGSGYPANGNQGAWKSTDGGVTWNPNKISNDNDPYNFDIDPSNKNHAICAMHASDHIFESTDAGVTWADKGSAGVGGSEYVFFITSTIWLAIGQDGGSSGTNRTTNAGATWANVGPMAHAHGNAQIFIDPTNGYVYAAGHNNGVYRSTNQGASFTQVSNIRGSCVWATDTRIYSMDPGANGAGTAPMPQSALRSNPTSWSAFTVPSGMTNGAKRAAAAYNDSIGHWVIVTGNWNAGFWRYVEP